MNFKLPINITSKMLYRCQDIEKICHYLESLMNLKYSRKSLKTNFKLQASLWSMEDGDKATTKEVKKIQNINLVLQHLKRWDPLSIDDFKKAHALLMNDLSSPIGCWRKKRVLVLEGSRTVHKPPKPQAINDYMRTLFNFIKENKDLSWIIKACVFHYGIQYIHPFFDGNGRMGRLWQHLLLLQASPIFNIILIGNIIRNDLAGYYKSLDESDLAKNGGIFIDFCLRKLNNEARKLGKRLKVRSILSASRFYEAWVMIKKKAFILDEYMVYHPKISIFTARSDIRWGKKHFFDKTGQ